MPSSRFGLGRDMEVVNHFLPERPLAVSAGGSPHERPYFLFAGRLEKIKGLDDVIPLFARYQGADLLVAGDGEYAAVLRELAKGIDRVKFLGRIDSGKLDRYYHHALALIVPSVCFETFGIILIEAFRQGTPVLARRLGPFPEIVERARGGLLFDGPGELLESMRRRAPDPGGSFTTGQPVGVCIGGIRPALDRKCSDAALSGGCEACRPNAGKNGSRQGARVLMQMYRRGPQPAVQRRPGEA